MRLALIIIMSLAMASPGLAECKYLGAGKGFSGNCVGTQFRNKAQKRFEEAEAAKMKNQINEIASEKRSLERMKAERERSKTTTEHCYYAKNGSLECKPAP